MYTLEYKKAGSRLPRVKTPRQQLSGMMPDVAKLRVNSHSGYQGIDEKYLSLCTL